MTAKNTTPAPAPEMTPKALAAELAISPKALRRILRSMTDDRAGKGGTWKLDDATCDAIRTRIAEGVRRSTTPTLKG